MRFFSAIISFAFWIYAGVAAAYTVRFLLANPEQTPSLAHFASREARIDHHDLANSLLGLVILLCVGAVAGVFATAFVIGLIAFGGTIAAAGPLAFFLLPVAAATTGASVLTTIAIGAVLVPAWGTLLGIIGLGGSREFALRASGGSPIHDTTDRLVLDVADLSRRLGLPQTPMAATMPIPNAFAIGTDLSTSIVAVGTPLIEKLTPGQVRAVVGHELGHLASRDSARLYFAECFQNSLVWFLGFRGLKIIGRRALLLVGELTILGISRRREYWADAVGAALTSKEDMIGALRALETLTGPPTDAERDLQTLMFFERSVFGKLFSTHPSIASRIAALESEKYIRLLPVRMESTPGSETTELSWDTLPSDAGAATDKTAVRTVPMRQPTDSFSIVGSTNDTEKSSSKKSRNSKKGSVSSVESKNNSTNYIGNVDLNAQENEIKKPITTPKISQRLQSPSSKSAFQIPSGDRQIAIAGAVAGIVGIGALIYTATRPSFDTRVALIADRENSVRERESAASSREGAANAREQQLVARERAISSREEVISGREVKVLQREQDFDNLRRNAGPEVIRLEQVQIQQRNERQELDRQQRALATERSSLVQERANVIQLTQAAERATANATAERQRLELDRRNAGPEISRLEQARQQAADQQKQLADERERLREQQNSLQSDLQNNRELVRQLSDLRNTIVNEWNGVVSSTPANVFGAIAVDNNGSWWGRNNMHSLRSARQDVEQRCNAESQTGNCRIFDVIRACVAVARGGFGGWGVAVADTRREAGERAVLQCINSGNAGCRVTRENVFCSGNQ